MQCEQAEEKKEERGRQGDGQQYSLGENAPTVYTVEEHDSISHNGCCWGLHFCVTQAGYMYWHRCPLNHTHTHTLAGGKRGRNCGLLVGQRLFAKGSKA